MFAVFFVSFIIIVHHFIFSYISADNVVIEEDEMLPAVKFNSIFLNKNVENQVTRVLKEKIDLKNAVTYYQFADTFQLLKLVTEAFTYSERCFTMVSKTKNFLQLDFEYVYKILSSSELDIYSELEVFETADKWVSFEYENRSKFTKDLLLRVRFPLLSDDVVRKVLRKPYYARYSSVFQRNEDCLVLTEEILKDKETFYPNKSSVNYKNRCCSQNKYNILIYGGGDAANNNIINRKVVQVDGENIKNCKSLTPWPMSSRFLVRNVKSEIYSLFYLFEKKKFYLHKYSISNNSWENLGVSHYDHYNFGVCVFMDKIYIIGGCDERLVANSLCAELDINKCRREKIKNINEARQLSACTTFEGRVIVSGGYVNYDDDDYLNTVEVYDHVANKWSYMPNMIDGRCDHSIVAVRSKLFVFGGFRTETCEVFDSCVKKFVLLKPPSSLLGFAETSRALSVGSKILIFKNESAQLTTFDFVKNEWKKESFEVTKDIKYFGCLKLPKI